MKNPLKKDSTAAIGLAAAILVLREPDVIIGSFAADHVISDQRGFARAVVEAVAAVGVEAGRQVAAVAGGEEVVHPALDHVESERRFQPRSSLCH